MGDQTKDKGKDSQEDEVEFEAVEEETPPTKSKTNGEDKGVEGKKDSDEDEDDDESEEESDEDERVGHSEGDDDEDGEDEEDDKKDKPKLSANQRRKQRQREQRRRNETELNFLRQRNENLERRLMGLETRTTQNELTQVESRIGQLDANIKVAEEVEAEATSKGQGDDVVEARRIREDLVAKKNQLVAVRDRMKAGSTTDTANRPDPEIVRRGQEWLSRNRWYNPRSGDEDSQIVAMLDRRLKESGEFDPRSPEYWEELDRRAKKYLPHRFKMTGSRKEITDDEDEGEGEEERTPKKRNGGPRFSTRGQERPLKPNQVRISAERKEAMIEAGVWDDPVLRQKYLKRYAQWDKDNESRA
jgi:hypothetical protein